MANNVTFLYPGQGSQQVGMGFDLYQTYPEAGEIFDQANHLLGFSLSQICFEGPEEELNNDLNAQLAVYTISCILTDVLKGYNVRPDMVTGYSSGFYAAAYAAGCFDFADGLHVVRRAGEILLERGKKIDGGMAVIFGLSFEEVDSICQVVGNVEVSIANAPRQSLISGINSSVKKTVELSLAEGALDAYIISAATAYHSSFMEECSARFLAEFENGCLKNPEKPLISYSLLEPVSDKSALKKIMATQLSRRVLWVDLIKKLSNNTFFVEVGPGSIISKTVKWIDRDINIVNTSSNNGLLKAVEAYRTLYDLKQ